MDPREVSEDLFDGLGEIWEGFGLPNQDYTDKIKDTQFALLLQDDIQKKSEVEYSQPNQDGTNDGGTSIINEVGVEDSAAGQSGKSHEVITQLDQMEEKVMKKSRDSDATNPSKKRGSKPLNDEEKKERKRIADAKHRNKRKEYVKNMEKDLKAAEEKLKYHERANNSLNEEYNSMAQNLHNSSNQDGEIHSEIKRLNEVIGIQQQQLDFIIRKQILQVEVGKTDEESQSLKTENCELRRMNQSLIVERDTMKNNWQTATAIIKQLLSQISSFDGIFTQQQQLVDSYSSGLAEGREQQQKIQEWMRGIEESLNDCAEKEKAHG